VLTVVDALITSSASSLADTEIFLMDCNHEYESLPPSSTVGTHIVAGAASGILEHCFMYPIDSVKVCYCHYRYFAICFLVKKFAILTSPSVLVHVISASNSCSVGWR